MTRGAQMKWNRKHYGLSQKKLAELAGLSQPTIGRLERDHTAWLTVRPSTEEKIISVLERFASEDEEIRDAAYKELTEGVLKETEIKTKPVEKKEEKTKWPTEDITYEKAIEIVSKLPKKDEKTLTLLTTIWGWLSESKTHEEFEENINMMKTIIDQY